MSKTTSKDLKQDPVKYLPSDVWLTIFYTLIPPSHGGNPDLKNLGIVRRQIASLGGLYVDEFQSSKENEDYPVEYTKPMPEKKKRKSKFPNFKPNFLYPVLNEGLMIDNRILHSWSQSLSTAYSPPNEWQKTVLATRDGKTLTKFAGTTRDGKTLTKFAGKWDIRTMFTTNQFFSSVIEIEKNIRVKNIMKFVIRFSLVSKSWRKFILDGGNACTIVWDYLASIVFGTAFFAPKYAEQWVHIGNYDAMMTTLTSQKDLHFGTGEALLCEEILDKNRSSHRNFFMPQSDLKSFLPVRLDKRNANAFKLDSLSEKVKLVYRFMFIPHFYNCLMMKTDLEFPVKFHLLKFYEMYNIDSGKLNFDAYKVSNFGIYLELSRDLLGGLLPTDYYDMNVFFDDYIRKPSLKEVKHVKKYLETFEQDVIGILLDVIDKYEKQVKYVLKKRKEVQTKRKKLPMSFMEKDTLFSKRRSNNYYTPLSRSILGLTKKKTECKLETIKHLFVILDISASHFKKRNKKVANEEVDVDDDPVVLSHMSDTTINSDGADDGDDYHDEDDSEKLPIYYETHLTEQLMEREKPYWSEDEASDENEVVREYKHPKKRKRDSTESKSSKKKAKKTKVIKLSDDYEENENESND
jgi:hypothetical protein